MTSARNTVILGSTGSIGTAQVDRFASDPHTHVVALAAAGTNLELIAYQGVELGVYGIALNHADLEDVHAALDAVNRTGGTNIRPEVLIGPDAVLHAASAGVDLVVNAIEGIEGLAPSISALTTGAHLSVANTETLLSKELLAQALAPGEHLGDHLTLLNPALVGIQTALAQHEVRRIILTTRGTQARPSRRKGTPARVNARTGAAAGLAMLELRTVTDVDVEVVEHDGPVASIVELADGRSIVNHHPHAASTWRGRTSWRFEPVHLAGVELSRVVGEEGGTYPVVLQAANAEAVRAHLEGALTLERIDEVVAQVMDTHEPPSELSVETVTGVSSWAKEQARRVIREVY